MLRQPICEPGTTDKPKLANSSRQSKRKNYPPGWLAKMDHVILLHRNLQATSITADTRFQIFFYRGKYLAHAIFFLSFL